MSALTPTPRRGFVLNRISSFSLVRSICPSATMVSFSLCASNGVIVATPSLISNAKTVHSQIENGSSFANGFKAPNNCEMMSLEKKPIALLSIFPGSNLLVEAQVLIGDQDSDQCQPGDGHRAFTGIDASRSGLGGYRWQLELCLLAAADEGERRPTATAPAIAPATAPTSAPPGPPSAPPSAAPNAAPCTTPC